MKLYRFSPIRNKGELLEAVEYIHFACHELCKRSFGRYLPNAGNVGVFCHYDAEFEELTGIRKELTESSDHLNQKYFRLHRPIVIAGKGDVPETTYTYLYVRKPDPYRHHVGDVDFFLEDGEYTELKKSLQEGRAMKGVRLFPSPTLDMIELHDPDSDVLAYVSTKMMTDLVKTTFSKS